MNIVFIDFYFNSSFHDFSYWYLLILFVKVPQLENNVGSFETRTVGEVLTLIISDLSF